MAQVTCVRRSTTIRLDGKVIARMGDQEPAAALAEYLSWFPRDERPVLTSADCAVVVVGEHRGEVVYAMRDSEAVAS